MILAQERAYAANVFIITEKIISFQHVTFLVMLKLPMIVVSRLLFGPIRKISAKIRVLDEMPTL